MGVSYLGLVFSWLHQVSGLINSHKNGDGCSSLKRDGSYRIPPDFRASKKSRLSSMSQSVNSPLSRISRYPEAKTRLAREVHAPSRIIKFGFSDYSSKTHKETDKGYNPKEDLGNGIEVIDVDDYEAGDEVLTGSSGTQIQILETGATVRRSEEKLVKGRNGAEVIDLDDGNLTVDSASKMLGSLSLNGPVSNMWSIEAHRKWVESPKNRMSRLMRLGLEFALNIRHSNLLRKLQPWWTQPDKPEGHLEPFMPLSREEQAEVERRFSSSNSAVLVRHQNSNIEITGQVLQCLGPGQWLNDEIINLYLELLRERQIREPRKFLKCHFFNTFFLKKLFGAETGYCYGAVRRWTSPKRLGYYLIDCEKVFVPIHRNVHWTLAVINNKERKFQYLDSFKGKDFGLLDLLARYFVEEVKNKSGKDIDVSSWEREHVRDLPEQRNGFDCGMFMLKYMDFYARDLELCFSQEHMSYFRVRTAMEILRLRAD